MIHAPKIVKRLWLPLAVAVALFLAIIFGNYARFESRQLPGVSEVTWRPLDQEAVLARFVAAIRIRSVSSSMAEIGDDSPLREFAVHLQQAFPALHTEPFSRYTGKDFGDERIPSLMFEWPGKNPELGAVLLMSHFDVVPADEKSTRDPEGLRGWTHPPFAGHADGTHIWGRGTLDCKHGVMAILEAIDALASEGVQPERTVFVALGHDEELGGQDGNGKMAEWLRAKRGRNLHVILDEGGCIFTEFPGLDRPAALIGVAEKGYLAVELKVALKAEQVGHASMPPSETAVSILSAAVQRIQASPFPTKIDSGLLTTLQYIGPEMPSLSSRVAIANMWLFSRAVQGTLGEKPSGNALLRTTIAPTLLRVEGQSDNVLPSSATATLNLRLLPGDSIEYALQHLRDAIHDPRVEITTKPYPREASPVSSNECETFEMLHKTIRQIYPDVVVAPFVLVGATDTVHYVDMCQNIYRFIPARLSERDTKRFHGIDERISQEDYLNIVRFIRQFILNSTTNVVPQTTTVDR